jgi:hypothetical protein
MTFSKNSRYADNLVGTSIYTAPDGEQIAYKDRRFCPQGETISVAAEYRVGFEDRLDNIAAKFLGDPELFWRICDANNADDPFALVSRTGRVIRIPDTTA